MSPVMHNAAFRELGFDYVYVPFRVEKDGLGAAIAGMRSLNIRGLNVTIPHKVGVITLLDSVDETAMKIGAVNTIASDGGTLIGYNTDAPGFLRTLQGAGVETQGARAAIMGAGGVARAIAYVLAGNGAQLFILNRTQELDWAEELAGWISRHFRIRAKALDLGEDNLKDVLEQSNILINATSVGMAPDKDSTPLPARLLREGLVVFDAVYNPVETRLLKEARVAGAQTIGGLDMLVWQGAIAFEIWTGQPAPFETMKREVLKALGYEG
jgi:shikimate dehydrogenase